ncbi:hypothetical protein B0O80DRAFT_127919 [Mortierella sp. GBAus27b]|nr:hypothetical protein B0O80DRAFT_127919 [Mortierella sp. GBAus27b]
MEVNKDEALRCLEIARRHLSSGNFASARKFGRKSISLYPTSEAEAFIIKVESVETMTSEGPSPSSGTKSSEKGNGSSSSTTTATSSTKPSSSAGSRPTLADHKPVEREYTAEQAAAVKVIRSSGGDFYKILGVNKDATDTEIKKAYRKLALQMHPDKNSAPGADEAFKIVSKAFTVLSDPDKRAIFDQHGPDEGHSSGVNYDRSGPSGPRFAHGRRGANMNGYGEEISPEELFNMFFRGGSFSSSGSFPSHTYAGARHRPYQSPHHQQRQQFYRQHYQQQRQQRADANGEDFSGLLKLLPVILLIILSVYSNYLFPDSPTHSDPSSPLRDFSLRPKTNYLTPRHTTLRNVPYFVNEDRFMGTYFPGKKYEFSASGARQLNVKLDHVTQQGRRVGPLFKQMEDNVEAAYLKELQSRCKEERRRKTAAMNEAMGFWGADRRLLQVAQRMPTPSCTTIEEKFGSPTKH